MTATFQATRLRPFLPAAPVTRRCVEFREGRARYWALLGAHDPAPTTWDEAERLATGSVCLDSARPRNWEVVAVVTRGGAQ